MPERADTPRRVEALINPALLVWARTSAGFDLEGAAEKIGVSADRLRSWERAERRPTIPQLRKLANVYKRPIALFYLASPPADAVAIRDFRRLPGEHAAGPSPNLRWEIRRARERRQIALDLYEELGENPAGFEPLRRRVDDPEELAARIRSLLAIDFEAQVSWQDEYQAFDHWRGALEARDVLVFQATQVALSEMRGFSIGEFPLPVVVANIKDSVRGRIFTMLHEFAHIMIHEAGLCNLEEHHRRPDREQQIEIFCNHVAGAVLVPADWLLREQAVVDNQSAQTWSDDAIAELARRFWVSREALLRRLLVLGRTTESFYRQKREQYQRERRQQRSGGFAPPYRIALSSAGPLYVSLVLNAYNSERITASDLSDYLNVRLQHVTQIEQQLARRSG